ncbi:MAG TPA: metal ABC transporter substrate-binding protein [Frankiaceae bacterium]|nr:metal ABC transporter substrate-binding protein [Frankiaceae bacterium]
MRLIALPLAVALAATGCVKDGGGGDGGLRVVAGLYPLAYVARAVGGGSVDVVDLTPPGAEPHDVELAPSQVAALERADVVLLVPGFQPEADAAARDAAKVPVEVERSDPHVWLDPTRLRAVADALAERLTALDPDGGYAARAERLTLALTTLDADIEDGLETCARRDLVTSHAAFGYFARRYGLTQVSIAGVEPDADPPPGTIAEIARYVREKDVTTVFFEALVSPKVAEAIAREAGARAALLDPVESVSGGDDYESVMRRNLATLRPALGCR